MSPLTYSQAAPSIPREHSNSNNKLVQSTGDVAPLVPFEGTRRLYESTMILSNGVPVYFRWFFSIPGRIARFLSGLWRKEVSKRLISRPNTPSTETTETCELIDSDSDVTVGKYSSCISAFLGQKQFREAQAIANAEKNAVETEHSECITRLEFSIKHHVEFGQNLCIVGSVRELGNWDPNEALTLQWSEGDVWKTSVSVNRSQLAKIEYKYFVKSSTDIHWEGGGNHNILKKSSSHIELVDVWEFPGYVL